MAMPTFSQLFISGATKLPTEDSVKQHATNLNILAVIFLASHNIIRVIKSRIRSWGEHVKHRGKTSGAYKGLVGKPEGQRPCGRPRRRWEDNIKMDIQEVRWVGMDWIDMAWDRDRWRALINVAMNLRVP
jgi:hypothetical protein